MEKGLLLHSSILAWMSINIFIHAKKASFAQKYVLPPSLITWRLYGTGGVKNQEIAQSNQINK